MKKALCLFLVLISLFSAVRVSAAEISAKAAVVINGDTGEILYSQNPNERLPMASTTKIMTSLLLCELGGDLNREIVTTPEMVTVEGSSMGLLAGDTVSLHDLLYGMMLSSGNDAANTTAIAIGGSINAFVDLMNERAVEMGLTDTHFATPSGLDAEGHYTTAYELALIARQALSNEDFAAAAASTKATLCYGNPPYKRTLTNHNKLLKMYDDIVGVKTGFTKKSGRCLVSASRKDGKFVIAVTLNAPSDWSDHRTLLDIGLSLVSTQEFSAAQSQISVNVVGADGEHSIKAKIPSANLSVSENTKVTYCIKMPKFLYAPVENGEKIGEIVYFCDGKQVLAKPINAQNGVKKRDNKFDLIFQIFKYILSIV